MHDAATGEALSGAFLAARARAHELQEKADRLRLDGAPDDDVHAAQRAARRAADAAYKRLLDDREKRRRAATEAAEAAWRARHQAEEEERQVRAVERERERLAEQENAAIERLVLVLKERGPMSGVELEALRIRGASKNALRPLLRTAEERGLVRRIRNGKRILWAAKFA